MPEDKQPSLKWTIITGVAVIFILLVVIYAGNIIMLVVPSLLLKQVVGFMNANAFLLLSVAFLFFAGEITGCFNFPYNIPSPLLNALGSVFAIKLLMSVFEYLNSAMNADIFSIPSRIAMLIYLFVFAGVLIFGYSSVYLKEKRRGKKKSVIK